MGQYPRSEMTKLTSPMSGYIPGFICCMTVFGVQQMKPFPSVTSWLWLLWFFHFLRIYSVLFQYTSLVIIPVLVNQAHKISFYECAAWQPMKWNLCYFHFQLSYMTQFSSHINIWSRNKALMWHTKLWQWQPMTTKHSTNPSLFLSYRTCRTLLLNFLVIRKLLRCDWTILSYTPSLHDSSL